MSAPLAPTTFFATLAACERSCATRVGDLSVAVEPVRLMHDPSLSFAAAEIGVLAMDANQRATLTCAFLGLTGCVSPLPEHLIEGWSQQEVDGPLQALFAVWQHRLLALLYRSVSKYSPSLEFSQSGDDAWSQRLRSWTPDSADLPLWRRLRWLPWLARKDASAAGLSQLLCDLLGDHLPAEAVALEPMTGSWQPLCHDQPMRLGECQNQLAIDAILGTHVLAPASGFRVHLGPLHAPALAGLTHPPLLAQVRALLRLYTPEGVQAELMLHVAPGAHPGWPRGDAQLGANTYLGQPQEGSVLRLPGDVDEAIPAA